MVSFPETLNWHADYEEMKLAGLYLGYLRGRSFPTKMPSFPPTKKYCSNYSRQVTISGKSTKHDEVSAKSFQMMRLSIGILTKSNTRRPH